jgi:hypothetical protein
VPRRPRVPMIVAEPYDALTSFNSAASDDVSVVLFNVSPRCGSMYHSYLGIWLGCGSDTLPTEVSFSLIPLPEAALASGS